MITSNRHGRFDGVAPQQAVLDTSHAKRDRKQRRKESNRREEQDAAATRVVNAHREPHVFLMLLFSLNGLMSAGTCHPGSSFRFCGVLMPSAVHIPMLFSPRPSSGRSCFSMPEHRPPPPHFGEALAAACETTQVGHGKGFRRGPIQQTGSVFTIGPAPYAPVGQPHRNNRVCDILR